MLGNPFDLLPKGAAAALLAYLGLCWVLGDTFAGRLAEKFHVPVCVSGIKAKAAHAQHGLPDETAIAREVIRDFFRQMPALRELPGGRVIEEMTQQQRAPANNESGATAHCACLAIEAQRETGIDHMLWVATLKVYTPSGVKNFQGVMTLLDLKAVCGGNKTGGTN